MTLRGIRRNDVSAKISFAELVHQKSLFADNFF